jgi:hypothetical protein
MVVVVVLGHTVILGLQEALEEAGTGQQAMVAQQPKEVSRVLQEQLYLEIAEVQVIVHTLPAVAVVEL